MKKKMKRYETGGSIDADVRARAMKFVEGLEGIKGSNVEDETGAAKGSIKRNEYGDLYDSEMKKATPKKAAPKKEAIYSPKSLPESDREENSAFMREFRKNEAAKKPISKSRLPMPDYSNEDMDRMGLDEFKSKRFDPAAAIGIRKPAELPRHMKKAVGMKKGGSVSSASKRADGCAIKGKTKGRMV